MAFGDEGKGGFTDYLASEAQAPLLIKCCGGAQASHTVVLPDGSRFRFAQLSAGMTATGAITYLSANFVVNPFSLAEECRAFSERMGISHHELTGRVLLDCRSLTVTRFHRAINRLEMERTHAMRGSVGTGVSTAAMMARRGEPSMRVADLFSEKRREILLELQACLAETYGEASGIQPELRREIESLLLPEAVQRLENEYGELFDDFFFKLCDGIPRVGRETICEGAQGFLLDYRYGTLPNVTGLDTSAEWIKRHFPSHQIFGALRLFWSRHGPGVFPSEEASLRPLFSDDEQEVGRYNGRVRYGYFDLVLFRYSVRHNTPDVLALSFADLLERYDRIPVCSAYICHADGNAEWTEYFEMTEENGHHVIHGIKTLCAEACSVLKRCSPMLVFFSTPMELFKKLEEESHIPVVLISSGPGRTNKRWIQT